MSRVASAPAHQAGHGHMPVYWLPLAIVLIVLASFVVTTRVVEVVGTPITVRWGDHLYECGYDPSSLVRCAQQEYR